MSATITRPIPPPCRRITPDGRPFGYVCTTCGRELKETKTGWFRHTDIQREQGNW